MIRRFIITLAVSFLATLLIIAFAFIAIASLAKEMS